MSSPSDTDRRFVILRHETPPNCGRRSHFDLMFEVGDVLRTWALASEPATIGATIDALRLTDHRKAYLDYEGPLSGDRGSVTQWDRGTYEVVRDDPDEFVARVDGQRITGLLRLTRLRDRWRLEVGRCS